MKFAYLMLGLGGLVWLALGSVVTIATPNDVVVARSLARNPENWRIQFREQSSHLGDAEDQKKALIAYIERSGNPIYTRKNWIDGSVAIGTAFSFLGWFLERRNEKKK